MFKQTGQAAGEDNHYQTKYIQGGHSLVSSLVWRNQWQGQDRGQLGVK